jgi:hypothetical protein
MEYSRNKITVTLPSLPQATQDDPPSFATMAPLTTVAEALEAT